MSRASKPEEFAASFADAFSSGDLGQVLTQYQDDAVLIDPLGHRHQGVEAIASSLRPWLSRRSRMTIANRLIVQSGELALLSNEVALSDASIARPMAFETWEVIRRGRDGRWRLVFDLVFDASATSASH